MEKIITIIGPTASGKTSFAVKLSKKINGEIISLDSRQIYQLMPIGTAQPSIEEMDGINHHLIGITSPYETVSAGNYAQLVKDKVIAIRKNKKTPIICGGAGLYYRAIKDGIFEKSSTDIGLREELEKIYDANPFSLMERLIKVDSQYAKIVHINNKKRLVRALEIFDSTGIAPSEHFNNQINDYSKNLDLYTIRLNWRRNNLINRINSRLEQMLAAGWVDEVKFLLEMQKQSSKPFPSLNSIGYQQIQNYLYGEITFDKMKENIKIKTRQFAKRQNQWFNNEDIELVVQMEELIIDDIIEILYDIFRVMP